MVPYLEQGRMEPSIEISENGQKLRINGKIMSELRLSGLLRSNRRGEFPILTVPYSNLPDYIRCHIEEMNPQTLSASESAKAVRPEKNSKSIIYIPTNIHGPGVYLMHSGDLYKIGCTKNIYNRAVDFLQMCPQEIELFAFLPTTSYRATEWLLHKRYFNKRIRGEWFRLNGDELHEIVATMGFLLVNKSLDDFLSAIADS